ncbi:hypothetical protein [Aquabacterium sp. CECT 9606]|uniref:hypothetical protein n=1 Tax=Aquabacterium sp. CECT 9606 TaxID=2845822 RepID=UPI001E3C4B09|nr:hypothetical protein [Aquabacterium sp. CECT 9606]CAH0352903.1 hypothetical protein AQB9606_02897 [Aquabacterium sp. CECT 9606]
MSTSSQAVTPALVTQKAVKRLPRWALLLFCVAYVLPGLFGRDPWKGIDIASFGHMWSMAEGQASWLHPNVGGVLPTGGGILPYWLGGAFIALLDPWLDPALAARIPFALLLASVLSLTWYATYHLARTKAAQPLPLAFGGEALPQDYARAVADGSVLALIASLGLLQLGHETTPELLQLAGSALFMYGLAAAAFRPWQSRLATLVCLPVMAASGSPTVAVELAAAGMLICSLSDDVVMRSHMRWVAASGLLAAALASALSSAGLPGWALRIDTWSGIGRTLRLFTWFTWPVLPLAALTVWHWRRQVARRHIAVPLFSALVGFAACIVMDANDRALLQALPALAVLAAFALPILQRSLGSAIDWFSVFFFTTAALLIWLHYGAMYTGVPAKMAGNVAKLVPGYATDFSWPLLILGAMATAAWLALVRWRTARQSHALWKSLVLPAGGVALCWLLAMTLLLPPLDQSLSYRLLVNRIKRHVPVGTCIAAPNASTGLLTGLEYFGRYRVDGLTPPASVPRSCPVLIYSLPAKQTAPSFPGWRRVARENQRTQNSESVAIYRRAP